MADTIKIIFSIIISVITAIVIILGIRIIMYNSIDYSMLTNEAGVPRFHLIEGSGKYGQSIYVDTQTGVEYFFYRSMSGNCTMTVLLDHYGNPIIAEGY